MDIRAVAASIAQSLQPGSPQRRDLGRRLEQLVYVTKATKAANVEATSLLTHITLVQARVFAPGNALSDRERELALESLREALTPNRHPRMSEVHAIIVDHLSRILIPLFAVSDPLCPEPTRQLAIACWRQLATAIASVHIPQAHPPPHTPSAALGTPPCTVALARYIGAYLPPDYLSLAACALLDNAELADSQQLRIAALEALSDILRSDSGILSHCDILHPIFPGVSSALARVALAQTPPALGSKQASGGGQQGSTGLEAGMAKMAIGASTWRKPTAAVRALAIDTLRIAILALYKKPGKAGIAADKEEEGLVAGWAKRARHGIESILHESSEEKESISTSGVVPADEYLRRLRHILWRLAGLRHTEHMAISRSLLKLFSSVALDCLALRNTPCASVAVEACFAVGHTRHAVPEYSDHVDRLTALCLDPGYGRVVAQQLDSVLPMFDRYISRGTETQRADVLALVAGYARVLPKTEAHGLLAPWWSARGLRLLLESLGISLPGTSLLITEVSSDSDVARVPVPFVLDAYRTAELRAALDGFVKIIAQVLSPAVVCAQLIAMLTGNTSALRPAALWLLTSVAPLGSREEMAAVYQPAFQYCVDYFGSSDSALTVQEPSSPVLAKSNVGSDDESSRVLQSCAVLNAISAIVPTMGSGAAYYLDLLLFPLLQISSADSPLLRDQAQRALIILAHTTGSLSIPDLLKSNIDYIIEGCSQQLRLVELHPQVFHILTSAVLLVGQDILVYLNDVVEDSLDVCEDMLDDKVVTTSALQFLEVVTRTVAAGRRTTGLIESGETGKSPVEIADPDPIGRVLCELDDWDAQDQISEFVDFGPSEEEPVNSELATRLTPENKEEEEEAGSPLAIKISLVAQNFLAAETGAQQLLALKIVQNAIHALTDTRDLLPLINEVWPALVHRLDRGRDLFYVTLAACDVIEAVCQLGESWMRKRVHDDLWLHFQHILREASPVSVAQKSTERDLVFRILRTMRTVVYHVPLDDPTAWDLSWLAMRFLESEPLSPHVLELLKTMVPVYGDKIWLILAKLGFADSDSLQPADIPNLGIPTNIKVPANICQAIGL
ncbi:hypothetical protein GGI03_001006 [Coemansia sp. RSA 2337]|nr:hypothetical protein H4S03_001005 [Coemansia sp. S3946]KAJ2052234.1 hypothetical protein H4S04_001469 [Coemansia sp. S16]KAJ2468427.1 hypothetical protein GGI03_001006 [Coemansia sp. RSA 2337]